MLPRQLRRAFSKAELEAGGKAGIVLNACDTDHLVQLDVPPSLLGDIVHICECVRRFRARMQLPPISMADLVTALLALPVDEVPTEDTVVPTGTETKSLAVPLLLLNLHTSILRLLAEDMLLRRENSELGPFGGGRKKSYYDDDDENDVDTSADWAFRQAQYRVNYVLAHPDSKIEPPKKISQYAGLSAYKRKKMMLAESGNAFSGEKMHSRGGGTGTGAGTSGAGQSGGPYGNGASRIGMKYKKKSKKDYKNKKDYKKD